MSAAQDPRTAQASSPVANPAVTPASGPSTTEIRELATHGLYDGANEKDACGLGFVAHIKGQKAHHIVQQGLKILENLDHRGAVAHQLVRADRTAVIEVLENLERLRHDGVALLALDVGHEPDPAGIVFVSARIQAVFLQMGDLGSRRHGAHLGKQGGNPRIVQRPSDSKKNKWGQIPIICRFTCLIF